VPVDTVNRVIPQLIGRGTYVRPTLGIEVDEGLNTLIASRLGRLGVAVLRVTSGSGAQAAGLRGAQLGGDGTVVPGDIIVAVNGSPVDSVARLLARLDDHQVGETVRLRVWREGREIDVSVKLGAGQ
jgi:S1-C subfamily serine protease